MDPVPVIVLRLYALTLGASTRRGKVIHQLPVAHRFQKTCLIGLLRHPGCEYRCYEVYELLSGDAEVTLHIGGTQSLISLVLGEHQFQQPPFAVDLIYFLFAEVQVGYEDDGPEALLLLQISLPVYPDLAA